ncbi:MAG: ATP-grasp domain-containing protein [Chloroflexota bacterium]|nr:ATP-grasp domain-containing protein [Chloroflexota bacterium]
MRIALITDPLRRNYPEAIQRAYHRSLHHVVENIALAIKGLGHAFKHFEANHHLQNAIEKFNPHIVFNRSNRTICDHDGASTPKLLDQLEIPYTGPNANNCVIAFNKAKTKSILIKRGLRTANFVTFSDPEEVFHPENLTFPLIVKPIQGGCSVGIEWDNLIFTNEALKRVCASLITDFNQPVIVESFINGREFTVGILGNEQPKVLPILEFIYQSEEAYHFRSFKTKMNVGKYEKKSCPAALSREEKREIINLAVRTYQAIGCRDYARIDMRFDKDHLPYVLEVNAFPSLISGGSSFAYMAEVGGLNFAAMIQRILGFAMKRHQAKNTSIVPILSPKTLGKNITQTRPPSPIPR